MVEIRIHGRGGQGGVTLAKLVATSRFLVGKSVQAFGLYAAERSGAPVQAFCRWDDAAVVDRNLIYEPDHVVVLDPTLVVPELAAGLKPGGWIVLNAPGGPGPFAPEFPRNRIAVVDASSIARRHGLGTRSVPIVNTALAGAVARVLEIPLEEMRDALEEMGLEGGNVEAAREAWEAVTTAESLEEPGERSASARPGPHGRGPSFLEGAGGGAPGIRTGRWATEQPRRRRAVPPCNHVCPAGNDVQGFLHALARDRVDEALAILLETSPFPATCGRVCPAPCMESCNRRVVDGAVDVRSMERLAGDRGRASPTPAPRRAERVAVVGSGPAGLTAAWHLALLGYRVRVVEAGPRLGGLLRTGIPEFRLPAAVLEREVARILSLGVEVATGVFVDRERLQALARSHDAVLVATGLQDLRPLELGPWGAERVEQGIDFLDRVRGLRGLPVVDGEDVVVVGGGNTAMDAARSALRLGAASVRVLYRRTREEMPAIPEEVDEALEEGVEITFLIQPVALEPLAQADGDPGLWQVVCRRMELGEPGPDGRRRPVEVPGSELTVPCHRLVLALGQSADLSLLPEAWEPRSDGELAGVRGGYVRLVGDLATGEGTVAAALGSGRRAAWDVHRRLSGEELRDRRRSRNRSPVDLWSEEVVGPEELRLELFEPLPATPTPTLGMEGRRTTFREVHLPPSDPAEARRCLSCGVCNVCEACVTYCPEGVLARAGDGLVFDYAYCKGCGVCVAECPRGVLFMSELEGGGGAT